MNTINSLHDLKQQGQKLKSQGRATEAIKEFSKLIISINYLFKSSDLDKETEYKLVKDLQIPTFLKLSSCYLSLKEDFNKVVVFCSDVIDIDQTNSKAFYFRARAYYEMSKFDLSLKDLNLARENDPNKHKYREFQAIVRKCKSVNESLRFKLSLWTCLAKIVVFRCKRRRIIV